MSLRATLGSVRNIRHTRNRCGLCDDGTVSVRLALIVGALGLALPASADGDSYFTVDHPIRDIDVHANHVAWTVADSHDRVHLRGGFAATSHELPIRRGFFAGIDLGTDSRGRTVLVYARCPSPDGRRCDLYLYRTGHGEHRLDSVSRRVCSETKPRIHRGVLLFTRHSRRSRSRRRRCSGGLFIKRPGDGLQRVKRKAPVAYDFAGRFLAFERDIIGPRAGSEGEEKFDTEIRKLRIGQHRSQLLARGEGAMNLGGSEGTFLTGPRVDGGFIYWQRSVEGPPRQDDILRHPSAGGRVTSLERAGRAWVVGGGDHLDSFAVYGARLFYLFRGVPGHPGFPIGRVEPAPAFR
jgi:hypothetical protein